MHFRRPSIEHAEASNGRKAIGDDGILGRISDGSAMLRVKLTHFDACSVVWGENCEREGGVAGMKADLL